MKIGSEYLVRRVNRRSWSGLARNSRIAERVVVDNVAAVLELLPAAIDRTTEAAISEGLDASIIGTLRDRIRRRVTQCLEVMRR